MNRYAVSPILHWSSIVKTVQSVMLIVLIWNPSHLFAQAKGARPGPVTTESLVAGSDVIVVGSVQRLDHEWTNDRKRIQTRVTFAIDQTIKGATSAKTITVVVPGGEVDGVGEWYSHTARFEKNEDAVLFAQKEPGGSYRLAGGEQGKFPIQKDARTGVRTVSNNGTLEDFATRIKSLMPLKDKTGKKE
jgi:hypothetical protein